MGTEIFTVKYASYKYIILVQLIIHAETLTASAIPEMSPVKEKRKRGAFEFIFFHLAN